MKKIAALAVLFVAGVLAAVALAHIGGAVPSCTGVAFTYSAFPTGSHSVSETVLVNGAPAASKTFVFTGTSGADTIALALQGSVHVQARASWLANGGGSFDSGVVALSCPTASTVSTTTTVTATVTTPPITVTTPPIVNTVTVTRDVQVPGPTVTETATVTLPAVTLPARTVTITRTVVKPCVPKKRAAVRKPKRLTPVLTPKQRCLIGGGVWNGHGCGFRGTG